MGWILVLACTTGRVAYVGRVVDLTTAAWLCLNDGQTFPWPHDTVGSEVLTLDAMLAHAVALHGAVLNVFTIPAL